MKPTQQQIDACEHVRRSPKHLALKARAGTGKSETIRMMVKECSTRERTLIVTFNKENQLEMAAKVPRRVDVKTLHALGFAATQNAWARRLETDSERQRSFAAQIIPQPLPGVVGRSYHFKSAVAVTKKLASLCGCFLVDDVEDILGVMQQYGVLLPLGLEKEQVASWVQHVLKESLKETTAISYDDMVYIPAKLDLRTGSYDNVFFDEAQDGNAAQKRLILNAIKDKGKIIVVGDDRQAIYVFRGAGDGAFDDLISTLDADVLPLSMTFRCPKYVVELVRPIVYDYEAMPDAPNGCITWDTEADLCEQIRPGHSIISRSNFFLTKICMKLLRSGVRVKIVGRDFGEQLCSLVGRLDGRDVNNMLERLTPYVTDESERLVAAGKEEKAEELADTAEALRELSEGVRRIPELISKLESLFIDKEGGDFVRGSTVHKAKGFQWNDVWMMESSFRLGKTEDENLYYVAATRTLWTPDHSGHLHLVQSPARSGKTPLSIARNGLLTDNQIYHIERGLQCPRTE